MRIHFKKMAGAGNDFIVIDNRDGIIPELGRGRVFESWCRRRVGVGADGVLLLEPARAGHHFRMRYYNADGGEVDSCGNGARCISRFAHLVGAGRCPMSHWVRMLNAAGEAWASWVWPMAWQVSVVAGVVALLTWALRRRAPASLRHGLWLLVLAKLLLPPMIGGWAAPGEWTRWTEWTEWTERNSFSDKGATLEQAGPGQAGLEQAGLEQAGLILSTQSTGSTQSTPSTPFTLSSPPAPFPFRSDWPSVPAARGGALNWPARLMLVWLGVGAALGWLLGWRGWRLRRLIRAAPALSAPDLLALLEEFRARMGVRRPVRLVELAGFEVPCVTGIRRPVIILPAGIAHTPALLRPILAHELAHVARRDILLNRLQVLLQILYWYHPLVWWANARLRQERELACDDRVLAVLTEGRREYAASLIEMARRRVRRAPLAALTGMAEPGRLIARRIRHITDEQRKVVPNMKRWMVAFVLLLGLALLPLGARKSAQAQESPAPAPAPEQTPAAAEGQGRLDVRAWIDGRSQLVVRGPVVFWRHLDYDAPGKGLSEGQGHNEPTYLNKQTWMPGWPETGLHSNQGCESTKFDRLTPPLPLSPVEIGVVGRRARGRVAVVQEPKPDNDYTLIVEFDDNNIGGADWYDVSIVWPANNLPKVYQSPTPGVLNQPAMMPGMGMPGMGMPGMPPGMGMPGMMQGMMGQRMGTQPPASTPKPRTDQIVLQLRWIDVQVPENGPSALDLSPAALGLKGGAGLRLVGGEGAEGMPLLVQRIPSIDDVLGALRKQGTVQVRLNQRMFLFPATESKIQIGGQQKEQASHIMAEFKATAQVIDMARGLMNLELKTQVEEAGSMGGQQVGSKRGTLETKLIIRSGDTAFLTLSQPQTQGARTENLLLVTAYLMAYDE